MIRLNLASVVHCETCGAATRALGGACRATDACRAEYHRRYSAAYNYREGATARCVCGSEVRVTHLSTKKLARCDNDQCVAARAAVRQDRARVYGAVWRAHATALRFGEEVRCCAVCGTEWRALDAPLRTRFCSSGCAEEHGRRRWLASHPDIEKTCAECRAPFAARSERQRYCSRECLRARQWRAHPSSYRRRARRFGAAYEPVSPLQVFRRDGWRCQICGRRTPERHRGAHRPTAPELDHRVPLSVGGDHTWENVQCACRRCNAAKNNRTRVGQMPMWPRPEPLGRGAPSAAGRRGAAAPKPNEIIGLGGGGPQSLPPAGEKPAPYRPRKYGGFSTKGGRPPVTRRGGVHDG